MAGRPLFRLSSVLTAAAVGFGGAWIIGQRRTHFSFLDAQRFPNLPSSPPQVPPSPVSTSAPLPDAGIDLAHFGFCSPEDLTNRTPRPRASSYVQWHSEELVPRLRQAASEPGASDELGEAADAIRADPLKAIDALSRASDRRYQGKDLLALAMVRAGEREHDPAKARQLAKDATHEDPTEAATWALLAVVNHRLHVITESVTALKRAAELNPADPGLELELGMELRQTFEIDRAYQALQRYLKSNPNDGMISRMAARLSVERDIEATYVKSVSGPITLIAPPSFGDALSMANVAHLLRTQLEEAARFTDTPLRDALTMVIYPGREELLAVTCAQDWVGGLYDGTVRIPMLKPRQFSLSVVRHELVHAQALSRLPTDKPLWFTEGLADYFGFTSDTHLAEDKLLLQNRTFIPVSSLIDTFQVMGSNDAGLAYAESVALVAMIVDQVGPSALGKGLKYLEEGGDPAALDAYLFGHPISSEDFLSYLPHHLENPALGRSESANDSKVDGTY